MNNALVHRNVPLILAVFTIYAFANGMYAGATAPQSDKTKNLTGAWTLNKSLSDDPAKVIETMQAERLGGSGGGASSRGQSGGHGPWMHGGGGTGAGRGEIDRSRCVCKCF